MKLNEDKCHVIVSGQDIDNVWFKVNDSMIWESQRQKLLGVTIDKNLMNLFFQCVKKQAKS